jgi:hypothetical protein
VNPQDPTGRRRAAPLVALGFCALWLAAPPAPLRAASLEGRWEGTLDVAERPLRFSIRFARLGDGWAGQMDVLGQPEVPLAGLQVDGERVTFRAPGDPPLAFDGHLEPGGVAGTVTQGDRSYAFRLEPDPELPPPAGRVEAWLQDLDVAERKLLRFDRSFHPDDAARFRQQLAELRAALPTKSDPEVVAGLARAVALAGNAHTRLHLFRSRAEVRRLPVRLWWFDEGLFVVRAGPGHADLLGCRVEAIAGEPVAAVRKRVDTLIAGNASWRTYQTAALLTSREVLQGVGVGSGSEVLPWSFRCRERRVEARLAAVPVPPQEATGEAWRELSPAHPGPGSPWLTALQRPQARLPLYLRHPGRYYWVERLRGRRALYVQYNRALNMPGMRMLPAFAEEVAAEARGGRLETVVLDLRFNTGGDLTAGRRLMERIRELARAARARVAVITGRATFSAGLFHAAQWRQWGAQLFGEAPGDELDFWAEGGTLVLPNSKLPLLYSDGFHAYSTRPYPDTKTYMDLDVKDMRPDQAVRQSWRDYLEGRDPALEAALTFEPATQTDSMVRVFTMSADGSSRRTTKSAQAPGRRVPTCPARPRHWAASPVAATSTWRGVSPALTISSSSMCSK